MKFYSETLNEIFDTEEQLKEAELEKQKELENQKAAKEKRAEAAREVEDAFKEANEAYNKANELLSKFLKEFGSYHMTLRDTSLPKHISLFDYLFDNYF